MLLNSRLLSLSWGLVDTIDSIEVLASLLSLQSYMMYHEAQAYEVVETGWENSQHAKETP